jgi:hypothetical protein
MVWGRRSSSALCCLPFRRARFLVIRRSQSTPQSRDCWTRHDDQTSTPLAPELTSAPRQGDPILMWFPRDESCRTYASCTPGPHFFYVRVGLGWWRHQSGIPFTT